MAKKRPRRAKRPTAHEAFEAIIEVDDGLEHLPLSDEEGDPLAPKDKDRKIIARDGQLGFSHSKKGFDSRTNFTFEIFGDIHSLEYQMRGTIIGICSVKTRYN